MRNLSKTSDEYLEGLQWLVHHEELRGYVPTAITTKDFEMPDGSVEPFMPVDQIVDILLGILQAHQDGAIRSPELLRMVPHVRAVLPSYLRVKSKSH